MDDIINNGAGAEGSSDLIGKVAPQPLPTNPTPAPNPAPPTNGTLPPNTPAMEGGGQTGKAGFDYTQIGVQILLVSVAYLGIYYFRSKTLQNKTVLAQIQAENKRLLAENQSLKNPNANIGV